MYLSACMMFLMSLLLLSGWIAVVSSITLMGVDFMLGFGLYLILSYILLICMLMTLLLIRTPGVVVLFRYIHSSTLFLQHPIGFQPVF